jgi:hypothetical protein
MKFYEELSSGSRVVPRGQTDGGQEQTGSRTDMAKLTVTFRNFANAPKEQTIILTEQNLNLAQSAFRAVWGLTDCTFNNE